MFTLWHPQVQVSGIRFDLASIQSSTCPCRKVTFRFWSVWGDFGKNGTSLNVKDIKVSKEFYENLGFSVYGGDIAHNYLIMKNGNAIVGLFQGMFEDNILAFNPGWDENANALDSFDDMRTIQA